MTDLAFASTTALVEERTSIDIARLVGERVGGFEAPPGYEEHELAPEVVQR